MKGIDRTYIADQDLLIRLPSLFSRSRRRRRTPIVRRIQIIAKRPLLTAVRAAGGTCKSTTATKATSKATATAKATAKATTGSKPTAAAKAHGAAKATTTAKAHGTAKAAAEAAPASAGKAVFPDLEHVAEPVKAVEHF